MPLLKAVYIQCPQDKPYLDGSSQINLQPGSSRSKPKAASLLCLQLVFGGSLEHTHQFEYIELHVEINLSIPKRIGV